MKAFTNKVVCVCVAAFLCACAQQDAPVPAEENTTVQPITETVEIVEVVEPAAPVSTDDSTPVSAPAPAEKQTQNTAAPTVRNTAATTQTTPAKTRNYSREELLAQLKKREQNLKTFQTDFSQVSSYDGVEINRSRGRLYYDFTRGLMRWEMLDAAGTLTQAAVTNKKEIIILDDAAKPVSTLSWQDWQKGQPNQALFDIGNYAQLVSTHRVDVTSQDNTQAVLTFTPLEKTQNYTLSVTLSKTDFVPLALTLQADDMKTDTQLSSTRTNAPLTENLFGGFFK